MKLFICFLFIFFFLLSLSFFVFCLPVDKKNQIEKGFRIEKGQNVFQIAENLEKENLIRNKFVFKAFLFLTGKTGKLQAGFYLFSPSMNVFEIAKKIFSGDTAKIKITIPEGFNLRQIESEFHLKLKKTNLSEFSIKDFKDDFDFLKDAPENAALEGFLFPDTYEFSYENSEREIAKKMLENFDKKLTPEIRKEIKNQNKTIFEIIIIASLIEKEVRAVKDKKLVSGILWKRLKTGMPLQVDATITYLTGKKTTKVSIEETKIDSPYNTYKYPGLPIGPICSPGFESIFAAIYSETSPYWYYLSDAEGETIFSRTFKEHNIAKTKNISKNVK